MCAALNGYPALFLLLLGTTAEETPFSIRELQELELKVMDVAERSLPAIVFIDGGSGVIINPEGYVITNNHVIEAAVRDHENKKRTGPVSIKLQMVGGRGLRSQVVGRDPKGDIALLKILEPGPYPHLEFGNSDGLRPGQWVLAMGNPFLLGESPFPFFAGPGDFSPSVSLGVISALHRSDDRQSKVMYSDAIQVDVAVNPGSSGGPLLTTDGKVIGINGKIQTRFMIEVNSGVGYAIPSNQVARFLEPLKRANGGMVRRGGIIGLLPAERGNLEEGLRVVRVSPGSPSERSGFRRGDRILSVDGHRIWNRRRLDGLLATYPAGSQVSVVVNREGATTEIIATLDPDAKGWLGVRVQNVRDPRGGVRIHTLTGDSPAAKAGLEVGDIILQVEDKKLENVVDLLEAVGDSRAGDTIQLVILRDSKETIFSVRLGIHPDEG